MSSMRLGIKPPEQAGLLVGVLGLDAVVPL